MTSEHIGTIRLLRGGRRALYVFTDALVVARGDSTPVTRGLRRALRLVTSGRAGQQHDDVGVHGHVEGTAAAMAARHPRNRMYRADEIGSARVGRDFIGPTRVMAAILADHTDAAFFWSSLYNRDDVVRPLLESVLGPKLEWRVSRF